MRDIRSNRRALYGALSLLFAGILFIRAATPPKNVDYPYYGGDAGAMRYSTLTQINAKNASQLKEVWRYDLGGPGSIENQPIVVNGIIYGVGLKTIYALDAATGKVKWPPVCGFRDQQRARTQVGKSGFDAGCLCAPAITRKRTERASDRGWITRRVDGARSGARGEGNVLSPWFAAI